MAIFMVPKEFYGLGGIGEAVGKIGAAGRDYVETGRRREREDFIFDEAKRDALREEENEIIKLAGQGSEEHLKWRTEKGLPTEGILVPLEVRQEKRRQELATIPPEQLTPIQSAELDALEGRPPGGYAEVVRSLSTRAEFEKLQLATAQMANNAARLGEERTARAREVLKAKYRVDDGELDAMMQYAAYENTLLSQQATRANINETNARTGLYRAQAASETVDATGYSPADMRSIAKDFRDSNVTLNGRPVTEKDVRNYLSGTMSPQDKLQMDRNQMRVQLGPIARDTLAEIARINKDRVKIRASRTVTLRQKDSESKQAALDDYDAQLAALDAEERLVRNDFESQREAISRVPQGTAAAQRAGRGTTTNTTDTSSIPPGIIELAKSFTSLAAIEALDATPEEKAQLKAAFMAANPNADISLPAKPQPVATTPARPSQPARPAARPPVHAPRFDAERTKMQEEEKRLEREIAALEKKVSSPSMRAANLSEEDRRNLATWNSQIETKKARLVKVQAAIENWRG